MRGYRGWEGDRVAAQSMHDTQGKGMICHCIRLIFKGGQVVVPKWFHRVSEGRGLHAHARQCGSSMLAVFVFVFLTGRERLLALDCWRCCRRQAAAKGLLLRL